MTPLVALADLKLPANIPILGWAWDDLLFLILAGVMLGCALFVVLGRNIVRSGIAMMGCFAALAGIYVLSGAVIVAATEVLVYIGAISVLILFAIMLTQTKSGPTELVFHHQAWAGALAINIIAVGGLFVFVFVGLLIPTVPKVPVVPILVVLIPIMLIGPIVFYPFSKRWNMKNRDIEAIV